MVDSKFHVVSGSVSGMSRKTILSLSAAAFAAFAAAAKPHVFSMSFKVTSLNGPIASEQAREKTFAWLRKNHFTKVWLESYRHGERVPSDLLARERDAFRAAGFAVSGMVTPTMLNDAPAGGKPPMVTCWSDSAAQNRLRAECVRAAELFDQVIVDDFLFSGCGDKCARCAALKRKLGMADWGAFKRHLMMDVARRCIVEPSRAANPKIDVIVKFPCWYQSWFRQGYSPVEEPRLFGSCWAGTETRDANPDPVQGCNLVGMLDDLSGGRCGGGWYDGLDSAPEKFVEQARYTILGGARESFVHCYDYLIADDPGVTPFGEKADRGHACAAAFEKEADGLFELAGLLNGAKRVGWNWVVSRDGTGTGVSRHAFDVDGRRYVAWQNTTGEARTLDDWNPSTQRKLLSLPDDAAAAVSGGKIKLAPHAFALAECSHP